MALQMMVIAAAVAWLAAGQNASCVRTQAEWLQSHTANASTMGFCQTSCATLLSTDTARQRPEHAGWLAAAHQHCAGALNAMRVDVKGLGQALLLLGDSLQNACPNISLWHVTPSLAPPLALLYALNQGALVGAPACSSPSAVGDTLYFYQPPDLLTWRQLDNSTQAYSVMRGYYTLQIFLCVALTVASLTCVALGVWIMMLRRRDRIYRLRGGPLAYQEEPGPRTPDLDVQNAMLTGDDELLGDERL